MERIVYMDRYDRNARLNPVILTLLPAFLFVFVWFPEIWTLFGMITSTVVASGFLYLLTQLVRILGHGVERKLGKRVGRLHTAQLLSLTDDRLSTLMKSRCRTFIEIKGSVILPSIEEEENDPKSADDKRLTAVKWLLEYTWPEAKNTLLLNENISYGFARNLLGLKPFGLIITGHVCIISIWFLTGTPYDSTTFLVGCLLCGISLLAFASWLFVVTETSVERSSQIYAEKILSLCLENTNVNH